jgi:hypothetical protein
VRSGSTIKRVREFVQLNLICVGLRRVRPRVAHQTLQRNEVTAALAKEAVREAMT